MEKLIIRFLYVVIASVLAATSSPVSADPGFRMSSKNPVPKAPIAVPQPKSYVFGYGGFAFGSSWENTGAFDLHPGWQANCPPGYAGHNLINPQSIPMDWETDGGWTLGGGVGRYSGLFGGSRFELEGTYLSNEVNSLNYAGFALPANFDLDTTAVMVNYLKEVPLGRCTGYLGGGIGWGWTSMDGDIDTILYSDSSSGFAWQLIAGIDFPLTESLALFTQYRYLVLDDAEFTTDFGDFTNVTDENPSSHSVLVGARVSF